MVGKHPGMQPEAVAAALETMADIASAAEGGNAQLNNNTCPACSSLSGQLLKVPRLSMDRHRYAA